MASLGAGSQGLPPAPTVSGPTGLAHPPAWAAHRRIHFLAAPGVPTGAGSGVGGSPSSTSRAAGSPSGSGTVVVWKGGPVQHSPHLYLIFWGANWTGSADVASYNQILSMYSHLSLSSYQNILLGYSDPSGPVSVSVKVTPWVDTSVPAPSMVTDTIDPAFGSTNVGPGNEITGEVARAVAANGWSRTADAQFIVLPAPGTSYAPSFAQGNPNKQHVVQPLFCGYHGTDQSGSTYAFVPFEGDGVFANACPSLDTLNNPPSATFATSFVASHEYAEAATDPQLNAWGSTDGNEIGDECESSATNPGGGEYQLPNGSVVTSLWDNASAGCVTSDAGNYGNFPPNVFALTSQFAPGRFAVGGVTGPASGGTPVAVMGDNFGSATGVKFGSVPAAFTAVSPNEFVATAPAGTAGSLVDIRVTTPYGTTPVVAADQFQYETGSAPAPVVSGVYSVRPGDTAPSSPAAGPLAGGTPVSVYGSGFTGATQVKFNNASVAFTVHSDGYITTTSPQGFDGTGYVNVHVVTPAGTSTSSTATQFVYGPSVTSVSPGLVSFAGGTTITFTGTGFQSDGGVTSVLIDGTSEPTTVTSDTTMTAVTPAETAPFLGTADIQLDTAGVAGQYLGGTEAEFNNGLEYGPAVTMVAPTSGPLAGGTSVAVSGVGFTGATAVYFNHASVPFTVNSDTSITATSPQGFITTGYVPVEVAGPTGRSSASPTDGSLGDDQFAYGPSVTRMSPTSGPPGGGTPVTLTGTGFTADGGVTSVTVGGVAASFSVGSDTTLTFTTPAGVGNDPVWVFSKGSSTELVPAEAVSPVAFSY